MHTAFERADWMPFNVEHVRTEGPAKLGAALGHVQSSSDFETKRLTVFISAKAQERYGKLTAAGFLPLADGTSAIRIDVDDAPVASSTEEVDERRYAGLRIGSHLD